MIFGIGLNKTGTTSLAQALRILGYTVHHSKRNSTEQDFEEGHVYIDCLWGRYRELHEKYPNAKFILTTRNIDDRINSALVHVLYNRIFNPVGATWTHIDTRYESSNSSIHNVLVRNYFKGKNLLELDVNDSWAKLCKFLDKPIPQEDWPHENSGVDRLASIYNYYKDKYV